LSPLDILATLHGMGCTVTIIGDRLRVVGVVLPENLQTAIARAKPDLMRLVAAGLHRTVEAAPYLSDHRDAAHTKAPIEARAAALRLQVEEYWSRLGEAWTEAKHLPIPPLSLPGVVAAAGGCELCGEPLTNGHLLRCSICVQAVNIMLARLRFEPNG
jgi:hypothetical protein